MPVYTAVTRIADGGQVTAVKPSCFAVLGEGESKGDLLRELWTQIGGLEQLAAEIEAGRHDPGHHHHHYWQM